MGNAGRHPYDSSWRGMNGNAANGQGERSLEHHHEGIERGRVFGESLPFIEYEQRDTAP